MKNQTPLTVQDILPFITEATPREVAELYASLPAVAAASDFGPWDSNLVVVDTETTGLSFNHDELIQIAAARVEQGQVVDWYITFVNPGQEIGPDIEHLTGIANADVADAPSPEEALEKLVCFVGDATLVAHNAEFDRTFLTRHVEGYPLLENLWVDSLDLARIALPRLRGHRLADLAAAFRTDRGTHRADDDVRATCQVLRILLAGVQCMPRGLAEAIGDMADVRVWPTGEVFRWFAENRAEDGSDAGLGAVEHAEGDAFEADAAGKGPDGAETLFPVPAATKSTNPSRRPFNLKAIRQARIKGLASAPRRDALDIVDDPLQELAFPSAEEVADAFTAQGAVGGLYERFEERSEQLEMAEAVRAAFAKSRNLVVEAGTGVGKSMAYLLPAALMAKRNGIAVGVATKTNALLDQLVYHELPALSQALGGLAYAPLKGFSHYACLRKVGRLVEQGAPAREAVGKELCPAPALATLLSFISQTAYDDIDTLKIDYRALPRWSITSTSNECLRRKCPYYGTACFVHGARRRAESADIVVTNHTLLFCDLKAEGGLLPTVRHWIVDEAHGAEAEARRAFSCCVSAEDLLHMASLVGSEESVRNVFVRAERRVVRPQTGEGETLFFALISKAKAAGRAFGETAKILAAHMKDLLYFDDRKRSRGYEYLELWVNDQVRNSRVFAELAGYAQAAAHEAERLAAASTELVAFLEECDNVQDIQREIATIALNCKELLANVEAVFGPADDTYAYSATLCKKNDRVAEKLEALVLNVGGSLAETLYANTLSVIYASATLTVDGSFANFERAVGLNQDGENRADELLLSSSYDFDNNMIIYVPDDMPEPNDPKYLPALQELLRATHLAQGGSMLTLFTNRKEMEACFDAVEPTLREEGLRLVCQKWGVSVKGLRDDFVKDRSLSLFALKSFWEGFDAPGDTLRGVIIPKLPFGKPTDPLSCERAQRDDAAWMHYVLPAAVIETRQAVGRLIRTASDRGVIILADKRLLTKSYGKAFLRSLPSRTVKACSSESIVKALGAMRW